MTLSEQLNEALKSPAIQWRSDRPGRAHYPHNWFDKVPLKVKMAKTVESDLKEFIKPVEGTVCLDKNEYFVWVNSYGAVSAILENGQKLGLLPSEFIVTEWHSE